MKFVMVQGTEGNGVFIAHFEREPALLREGEMMCLRRLSAADETGMGGHKFQMVFIA